MTINLGAAGYYSHVRSDVLKHVPEEARTILSVGCGTGASEEVLVARGCRVYGIEQDPTAAGLAAAKGITIISNDAETDLPRDSHESFDCIIYADVLEHLKNPLSVLQQHLRVLSRNGTIIISVPNYRFYKTFTRLAFLGDLGDEDAGIYDRTHLQFTTKKKVLAWIRKIKLVPTSVDLVASRRRERLLIKVLPSALGEFFAQQIIVVASR